MEFCGFVESLRTEIEKRCGDGAEARIQNVMGNNGMVHTAINIVKKGSRISPMISLEAYYENCVDGRMSLEETAKEIYGIFTTEEVPEYAEVVLEDFGKLKDKVIYSLVDYGRNQGRLEDMPYIRYCDLAIVFSLLVGDYENGRATAAIHNGHMEMWKVDTDTLYELAKANTPRLFPAQLKSMAQMMRELAGGNPEIDWGEEFWDSLLDEMEFKPLYILTNCDGYKGAAAVLYEGIVKNFAERLESDLFILPSSIHEVLLVPCSGSVDAANLGEMVTHINQTEVPEEQVLSDSVYRYSRKTAQITMVYGTGELE